MRRCGLTRALMLHWRASMGPEKQPMALISANQDATRLPWVSVRLYATPSIAETPVSAVP